MNTTVDHRTSGRSAIFGPAFNARGRGVCGGPMESLDEEHSNLQDVQPRSCAKDWRWRPCSSKFAGLSQASKAVLHTGHSLSSIENHAVSRLRPFMIMCW